MKAARMFHELGRVSGSTTSLVSCRPLYSTTSARSRSISEAVARNGAAALSQTLAKFASQIAQAIDQLSRVRFLSAKQGTRARDSGDLVFKGDIDSH